MPPYKGGGNAEAHRADAVNPAFPALGYLGLLCL